MNRQPLFYSTARFPGRRTGTGASPRRRFLSTRSPIPPMPRVMPTRRSWLRRNWDNGNVLLFFGYTGLSVLVLDRYLQYQQKRDANNMVQSIAEDAARRKLKLQLEWRDKPALYKAKIINEYKQMGGSHAGIREDSWNELKRRRVSGRASLDDVNQALHI